MATQTSNGRVGSVLQILVVILLVGGCNFFAGRYIGWQTGRDQLAYEIFSSERLDEGASFLRFLKSCSPVVNKNTAQLTTVLVLGGASSEEDMQIQSLAQKCWENKTKKTK